MRKPFRAHLVRGRRIRALRVRVPTLADVRNRGRTDRRGSAAPARRRGSGRFLAQLREAVGRARGRPRRPRPCRTPPPRRPGSRPRRWQRQRPSASSSGRAPTEPDTGRCRHSAREPGAGRRPRPASAAGRLVVRGTMGEGKFLRAPWDRRRTTRRQTAAGHLAVWGTMGGVAGRSRYPPLFRDAASSCCKPVCQGIRFEPLPQWAAFGERGRKAGPEPAVRKQNHRHEAVTRISMAGCTRLELATSDVTGRRSNQLS